MGTAKRAFRTTASLESEGVSRNSVTPFLESRGFIVREDHRVTAGTAVSQVITATEPNGQQLKMRVRLCWRVKDGVHRIAAAQLRARLIDDDWDKTLDAVMSRDITQGVFHSLFIQFNGVEAVQAALVPIKHLGDIWRRQREVSAKLIAAGKMGRVHKNHAANGNSPTIWLMDNRTPAARAVPDVLWHWRGVADLIQLPVIERTTLNVDDTYDDIPGMDYSQYGSDGAERFTSQRSQVKRDPRVRRAVIRRATKGCERSSCTDSRIFPGFLDVHHVLGAEISDRIWNCVALCPSCHRAAHFAPEQHQINAELLTYAEQFRGSGANLE